ncbi:MAG: AIR synthase family protein [Armatimonadota bacterium]
MQIGKLPPEVLIPLLSNVRPDQSVIIGPHYGEDSAAVRVRRRVLVAASDPVTFASDQIGSYAVNVNVNDIAAHGARPRWFLATILLPEGASESEAASIFGQINESCERVGVTLIGGHTEVTQSVRQTLVCGCMLGEVDEDKLVRTGGARVGDAVLLAGGIAIEGTAILARDASERLLSVGVAPDVIQSARRLLDDPGICILDCAMAAVETGEVTSMHDPTEGGLATALRELAAASGCGLLIHRDAINILPECRVICAALDLDPLGLIASGSLLITCAPGRAGEIMDRIRALSAPVNVIGEVVPQKCGLAFSDGSGLPVFSRDEIARCFEQRGEQDT